MTAGRGSHPTVLILAGEPSGDLHAAAVVRALQALRDTALPGAVTAAYYALAQPEVGGLAGLFAHPALAGKLSLLPDFSDWTTVSAVLVIPLAVQWWSTWYPGAEPGQRVERLMSDYFRHARIVSRSLEWARRTAPASRSPS